MSVSPNDIKPIQIIIERYYQAKNKEIEDITDITPKEL